MTTASPIEGSFLKAGVAATLALAAVGFSGAAQARDNVSFSFGVGVNNAYPVYTQQPVFVQQQPVYVQPQQVYVQPQQVYVHPRQVYVQPAPIYVAPRQVYYGQPVYSSPQPVYYSRPHGHGRHGGYYQQGPWDNGYSQTYYRRERGEGWRHERD